MTHAWSGGWQNPEEISASFTLAFTHLISVTGQIQKEVPSQLSDGKANTEPQSLVKKMAQKTWVSLDKERISDLTQLFKHRSGLFISYYSNSMP